ARENFGCGSSREHAVWALDQQGFRCVIATSFADIFYNNSFKSGFLPVQLSEEQMDVLFAECEEQGGYELTVDLDAQTVTTPGGQCFGFEIDAFRKNNLLKGLDDIGLTLQHADEIRAYEEKRAEQTPWLFTQL
ncbi:MAG: 3-isopropylmalate dehydratase small subunit, partial [Granulosicoccaceae bacterium]